MIGSDVQPLIFHGRNPCELSRTTMRLTMNFSRTEMKRNRRSVFRLFQAHFAVERAVPRHFSSPIRPHKTGPNTQ
jgi:hypothetical protein